jgi:hypothetical protein
MKLSGVALAALSQRQIGTSCVLTSQAPGSFAVSRQINGAEFFAHAIVLY